jgi:hypothetical protein
MEADWSVEIGADLPMIVVPWASFIDLRLEPAAAYHLQEAVAIPALAQALTQLNQEPSAIFTSKCDFWPIGTSEIDPLEFAATPENAKHGIACYIDIIARDESLFTSFPAHEVLARSIVDELRGVELTQGRVELVIRPAIVDEHEGFAFTLYVAACGLTEDAARAIFKSALEAATPITMKQAATAGE